MKKEKVIVAVSGGFDPLHIGHLEMFKEAKALGDTLVVILNNDNWIKQKKNHAFMPDNERAIIIKALEMVDDVVLTKHEENPEDMSVASALLEVKPHIFANGGDRTGVTSKQAEDEAKVCKEINCKMVFGIGKSGKIQSSSWLLDGFLENQNKNNS